MDYSSCKFEGSFIDGRFSDDHGTYSYPDGTKFVGSLKNGAFHGPGQLYFKGGSYLGTWDKGKAIGGEYIFTDNLKYGSGKDDKNWDYCDGEKERRFHSERQVKEGEEKSMGVGPAGKLQLSDKGEISLKEGCYDAGDGYLDTKDGKIHSHEAPNDVIRLIDEEERVFIMNNGATNIRTRLGKEEEAEEEDGY